MRGDQSRQEHRFSYVDVERRIPAGCPIRRIGKVVDQALSGMDAIFDAMRAEAVRPSIPPEQLLRALVVRMIRTVRSGRRLMERVSHHMPFRWFAGLSPDDPTCHPTTFTKNRDRLLAHGVDERFLSEVSKQGHSRRLLSRDRFPLDGALLEACPSIKSFRPQEPAAGPPEDEGTGGDGDFRGKRPTNATHRSTTDPEARLCRKGKGRSAKLCRMGHALIENRSGMVVGASVTEATGTAGREAGLGLLGEPPKRARRRTGAPPGMSDAAGAWSSASASRSRSAGPRHGADAQAEASRASQGAMAVSACGGGA